MILTYEQHSVIRKMIREKAESSGFKFAVISKGVGLGSNMLCNYLNGRRVLSTQTIKKVFQWLNLDFSEFQAIDETVTTKEVYLVKRGNLYYGGKKKRCEYCFGRIEFYVEVYTARQSEAKVFSNLRIARRVAKQINGQVVRLEKKA